MKHGRTKFHAALLQWYDAEARDLPWRRTQDPYCIWLSEIMMQQTRIDQGTPYYERFLKRFPDLQALAQATEEAVLKQWEGLGYYSRARNLYRTAQILADQYQGRFPESPEVLQMLPGIGKYTAGAIASIAFGVPVPVLDGNIKRVLARLYAFEEPINLPATDKRLWELAAATLNVKRPGDHNQAMMELGARICIPAQPLCFICPVQRHCRAFSASLQDALPRRNPKKAVPHHEMVVAVIVNKGAYLIGKRPSPGFLGGLWEFPGERIQKAEGCDDALRRIGDEMLHLKIVPGGLIAVVRHAYTHFKVTLNVYRCTASRRKISSDAHTEYRWVTPDSFDQYPFPAGHHKFLKFL